MKPTKPIVRVREVMKKELDIVDGMETVSNASAGVLKSTLGLPISLSSTLPSRCIMKSYSFIAWTISSFHWIRSHFAKPGRLLSSIRADMAR